MKWNEFGLFGLGSVRFPSLSYRTGDKRRKNAHLALFYKSLQSKWQLFPWINLTLDNGKVYSTLSNGHIYCSAVLHWCLQIFIFLLTDWNVLPGLTRTSRTITRNVKPRKSKESPEVTCSTTILRVHKTAYSAGTHALWRPVWVMHNGVGLLAWRRCESVTNYGGRQTKETEGGSGHFALNLSFQTVPRTIFPPFYMA